MKGVKIRIAILTLLVFLILLSGYLTYVNSNGEESGVCLVDLNGASSCSDVQGSVYGTFLGIKVCHWGLLAFSVLFLIYLIANTKNSYRKQSFELFLVASFIGALIALYFLFIQFFVLKSICSTCIIIDSSTILVFLLALVESRNRRR